MPTKGSAVVRAPRTHVCPSLKVGCVAFCLCDRSLRGNAWHFPLGLRDFFLVSAGSCLPI